jgi:hypothetical protein
MAMIPTTVATGRYICTEKAVEDLHGAERRLPSTHIDRKSGWICIVYRITGSVGIEITVASRESYRIRRSPPAKFAVIVASPESYETNGNILQATRPTERLNSRIRVEEQVPVFVVVYCG